MPIGTVTLPHTTRLIVYFAYSNVVVPLVCNFVIAGVCFAFVRKVRVCVTAWLVTWAVWVVADVEDFAVMYATFHPRLLTAVTASTPDPVPAYASVVMKLSLLLMFGSGIWAGIFVFRHRKVWVRAVVGSGIGVFWFVAALWISSVIA